MQTNFPTDPTHGPIRGAPSTSGSRLASIVLNFFSDAGDSVFAADVRHHAAQIPDLSTRIYQTGPLRAGIPVPHQFHSRLLIKCTASRFTRPLRITARKCSKLVPHRAGRSGINYRVDDSAGRLALTSDDAASSRPRGSKKHASRPAAQRNPNVFLESRIFGSHQHSLGTQHFGRFLAVYKSFASKTKFVSESRHRSMRALA